MSRIPFKGFVGSAFSAQSQRLDTQDLWNWYVERAGSPYAKAGQALLPCPGFREFAVLATGPVRGLFAQNDDLFAVGGNRFYQINPQGGIAVERPMTAITTPAAPTATPAPLAPPILAPKAPVLTHGGSTGSTTYGYTITALTLYGETTGSPQGTSAFGNATLTATNWNVISWSAVEHCTGYRVYRTTGGASPPKLIATVVSTTLVVYDTGQAGAAVSVPVTNTTGQPVGATTWGYVVTATLGLGETAASPQGLTTTGQLRLSSVDYILVEWKPVVNAHGYNVYRTTGSVSPARLIASVPGTTLSVKDIGEEGDRLTPPTVNTTGVNFLTGEGLIADDGMPVQWCSSGDAGEQLLFVSGDTAYCYDIETTVLAPVMKGAACCGYIDSYFVVLDASTSTLKVSESFEGFQWDATQVYQRSRAGDKWLSMAVTSNSIWLIGTQTGEVWVGTGDPESRFAPYAPVFLETGVLAAKTMIRVSGDTMMWVAQDKDGGGYVIRTEGYTPVKISTTAVDADIQNLSTVADGSAFSYQQEGHTFYVINFPTAKVTWVFDLSTNEWHRRGYWNAADMEYEVYRPQCHAFAFGGMVGPGLNLVGDRVSSPGGFGVVAEMSPRFSVDIDGGPLTARTASLIRRMRQCPHLADRDQELTFDRLQMDMEVGHGLAVGQGSDPTMMLSYSNNGAKTFGYELWRSAGKQGDYRIQVAWSRLGTGKDRVFRLVVSDPIPWRIVGAWLEMEGS